MYFIYNGSNKILYLVIICVCRSSQCVSLMRASHAAKNTKGETHMAVNVHGGAEVVKILMYVAAFAAFVVVALTWVPEWISPDSANITGNTGSTARMIQ